MRVMGVSVIEVGAHTWRAAPYRSLADITTTTKGVILVLSPHLKAKEKR